MAARRRRTKADREFVSEAEEILERMRTGVVDLSESPEADPETVNEMFRAAHSLKGLSGMFGLESISDLAHHLEDVLDHMRMGRIAPSARALALLEESTATLSAALEKHGTSAAEEAEAGLGELVARIEGFVASPDEGPAADSSLDVDPALLRALTEYEEHRLRESLAGGRAIYVVEATFELLAFEEGLAELTGAIREVGEVVSTLPSPGEAPESQIRFSLLTATELERSALASRLELADSAVRPASSGSPTPISAPAAPAPPIPEASSDLESLKSISDTVRVDIRKLDELMNLVGELVVHRTALGGLAAELRGDTATAQAGAELQKLQRGLERKLQELQAAVVEVRMVPLRQVFEKLSRVVRRLRRDTQKDVRLQIRGADTELDKLIVEELADPLMHLVRNAFDHAIEVEDERSAQGKATQGTIQLDAFQRGNDVVITVCDDGRGIDPELVHARAVERGMVSADAPMSEREMLDLVFTPGLSTRDEVTETSGRGVGMDVVRANITSLGGIVGIDSEIGRGTTVAMTLPITLAIIQALLVGVADQHFAIPLNSVRETLLLDPATIQCSEDRELLHLRGEALPLRRLNREFGLAESDPDAKPYAVVLGIGDSRLGLVVDRLEGQQDTVIKPIQGPVSRVRGIAGATELGDRGAVLVLDVSALVEDALRGGGVS